MYDYIIVGGGSAGCVLANKLSEDPNNQVLLLEAGPNDDSPLVRAPLGIVPLYQSPKYNWMFYSQEEPTQKNREIFCPQGKTLGGGSAINAMLYVRGHAWDYDNWEAEGNKGWGYPDMLKHFKACEHNEAFEDKFHGKNGPLNVQNIATPHPHAERLLMAALQAGHKFNPDFNGADQEGVGMYQVTIRDSQRFSAARAFLRPAENRPNLEVITSAHTCKVNVENGKAIGVCFFNGSKTETVIAKKEVILSAGAFNSPKLLMLSGIGPKEELEKHNIDVIKDIPGVGKNLQEHVDIVICMESKIKDTLVTNWTTLFQGIKAFIQYNLGLGGLFSKPVVESGGFVKSNPDEEIPDIQLQSTTSTMNDHGFDKEIIKKYGYALHVTLLRPKSRGSVTLNSCKPHDDPNIHLNMLDDPDDIKRLSEGVKIGRKIFSQPAYARHEKQELYPGENVQSDEEIADMLREKACHIYHPVGTCRMGNDDMAVVDDRLRVHGIENLRVVDASIMPNLVGGNTNAPAMAIGSKGAELILEDNK